MLGNRNVYLILQKMYISLTICLKISFKLFIIEGKNAFILDIYQDLVIVILKLLTKIAY